MLGLWEPLTFRAVFILLHGAQPETQTYAESKVGSKSSFGGMTVLGTSLAQLLEVAFLQELLVLATFAFSFILWPESPETHCFAIDLRHAEHGENVGRELHCMFDVHRYCHKLNERMSFLSAKNMGPTFAIGDWTNPSKWCLGGGWKRRSAHLGRSREPQRCKGKFQGFMILLLALNVDDVMM